MAGLAHRPVPARAQVVVAPAHRVHRVPLPRLALLPVSARVLLPVAAAQPVVAAPAQVAVVAGLVVVGAVRLQNRQWCSAAMARTTP